MTIYSPNERKIINYKYFEANEYVYIIQKNTSKLPIQFRFLKLESFSKFYNAKISCKGSEDDDTDIEDDTGTDIDDNTDTDIDEDEANEIKEEIAAVKIASIITYSFFGFFGFIYIIIIINILRGKSPQKDTCGFGSGSYKRKLMAVYLC